MPLPSDGGRPESAVYDAPPTFDPYAPETTEEHDPASVHPTSSGPSQSSEAPDLGDTSGADGQREEPAPDDPQDPLPEFDPKHRDAFTGLLYLGRTTKTVHIFGHTFVLKTLTTEQLAEIALIVKPYQGTQAENAVYQAAAVAAAVVTVDGKELPTTITVDNADELSAVRFPYVMKNWLPAVRERVFWECFQLETEVRQVLDAMGEARG